MERVRRGSEPGVDCPAEITWTEFVRLATRQVVRVQGRNTERSTGRLVRYNRSVRFVNEINGSSVLVVRVAWNREVCEYLPVLDQDGNPVEMIVRHSELAYVSPQASGNPNFVWRKVL